MGSYNYLIIPKFKVKIVTKVNTHSEYGTPNISKYDKLFDNEDLYDMQDNNLHINDIKIQELTISQASNMFQKSKIVDNINCGESVYWEEILIYYLEKKDIEYFTISEYDDEKMKEYENYKTIGL